MRKALVSIVCAVLTGVVLLGVNAAFGLAAPTQDPTAAVLVKPVFNGIDVQSTTDVTSSGGALTLKSSAADTTWVGLDDDEITAYGVPLALNYDSGQNVVIGDGAAHGGNTTALDVRGTVKNTVAGANVIVDDGLDLKGTILNSIAALLFGDDVVIQSATDAGATAAALILRSSAADTSWLGLDEDEIRSQGTALLINSDSDQDVIIGGGGSNLSDLDVRGSIFKSGAAAVKVDDNLETTGNFFATSGSVSTQTLYTNTIDALGAMTIKGSLSDPQTGSYPLTIDDDLDVTGSIANPSTNNLGAVKIMDALNVVGDFIATGNMAAGGYFLGMNAYILGSIKNDPTPADADAAGTPLVVDDSLGVTKAIQVQGDGIDVWGKVTNTSGKPLVLDAVNGVSASTNLDVTGKLTADTLGTYTEVQSSPTTLTDATNDSDPGTAGSATAACSAPAIIVSCSGRISASTGTHGITKYADLSRVELLLPSRTCMTEGHTQNVGGSGTPRYLYAKALCFDPGA